MDLTCLILLAEEQKLSIIIQILRLKGTRVLSLPLVPVHVCQLLMDQLPFSHTLAELPL